jgi:RNA-binding protein 39
MPAALALEQGLLGPASPIPTQCLLLKNMFAPEE